MRGAVIRTDLDFYSDHVARYRALGLDVQVFREIGTTIVHVYAGTAIETDAKYRDPKERIL